MREQNWHKAKQKLLHGVGNVSLLSANNLIHHEISIVAWDKPGMAKMRCNPMPTDGALVAISVSDRLDLQGTLTADLQRGLRARHFQLLIVRDGDQSTHGGHKTP